MRGGSSLARWALWARRLERFEAADLTVREFCQRERISQPSFYLWRKKLAGQQRKSPTDPVAPRLAEVELSGIAGTLAQNQEIVIRWPGGVEIGLGQNVDALERVIASLVDRLAAGGLAPGDA